MIQLRLLNDSTHQIVNVASVPHRSPFRYPGGKTWLAPRVRQWLLSLFLPLRSRLLELGDLGFRFH